MSVSASDGAEKLAALAEELCGNDPELGAKMLLHAAARSLRSDALCASSEVPRLSALAPALEPATKRPSVSAVSGGYPSRSATMAAQSVRTGARFTRMTVADMAGGYGRPRRKAN